MINFDWEDVDILFWNDQEWNPNHYIKTWWNKGFDQLWIMCQVWARDNQCPIRLVDRTNLWEVIREYHPIVTHSHTGANA